MKATANRQHAGATLSVTLVAVVTGVVVVLPAAISWLLVPAGIMTQPWLSVPLACLISLAISQCAAMLWQRNRRSADVLFSDLLLWGWLGRRASQRRLANAASVFAAVRDGEEPRGALCRQNPEILLRRLVGDLERSRPYTHGHSRRVARYASLIAQRMGLSPREVSQIRLAATLHDIGKLYTPRDILNKPGRLTEAEFAVIRRHPEDGARMIGAVIADPDLVAIVRHHHERLDGTGYPSRLAAATIPIGARIIAVADTFDAITSRRAYREASPHKIALDIMRAEAGTQLDPDAVHAFQVSYFGRRWLWLPAAGLSAAERLGQAIIARLTGTAAITAGAAALGAGVLTLPTIELPQARSGATPRAVLAAAPRADRPTYVSEPSPGAPRASRQANHRSVPVTSVRTISVHRSAAPARPQPSGHPPSGANPPPVSAPGSPTAPPGGASSTTASTTTTVTTSAPAPPAAVSASATTGRQGTSATVTGPDGTSASVQASGGGVSLGVKAVGQSAGAVISTPPLPVTLPPVSLSLPGTGPLSALP